MKQNDKRSAGMHVGSASIIMIFAVLCLTVFSTLSFVTANQERELAEKSALVMQQYYAADWQCEEQYEQIYQKLRAGIAVEQLQQELDVQVTKQESLYYITYAADIDETQQLQVLLAVSQDGSIHTAQWKAVAVQQQDYDDTLAVWDGE